MNVNALSQGPQMEAPSEGFGEDKYQTAVGLIVLRISNLQHCGVTMT